MFLINSAAHQRRRTSLLCGSAMSVFLIGCATPLQTNNIHQVQAQLAVTYPDISVENNVQKNPDALKNLLAQPITPQAAIQIMLLNSPQIEMALTELTISDATQLQASLISNPRISFALLKPENGNGWLWDLGLTQPLVELFTRHTRQKQAATEATMVQYKLVRSLHESVTELEDAYFSAIATEQQVDIHKVSMDIAIAKKELAASLYKAGNISELSYLEQVQYYQEQERQLASQQLEASNAKITLAFLFGFTSEKFDLPHQLPELSQETLSANLFIDEATQKRIDLQLAELHHQQLNAQLLLVKKEYGIADSNIGIAAQHEADGTSVGPQIEMAIPLFDNGQAKIALINSQIKSAKVELMSVKNAIARDINQAINAMNFAQSQYKGYADAQLTAERRVELSQREVNFMLSSPFELIDLKAETIQLRQQQTTALLAYWQARSQLELALGRRIPIENSVKNEHHRRDQEKVEHENNEKTKLSDEHHRHNMNNDAKNSGAHHHD